MRWEKYQLDKSCQDKYYLAKCHPSRNLISTEYTVKTPLLGEPYVFRTSHKLLNCYRVAQFVPCYSVCAMLLICAMLLSLCNICAQETLSNEL